VEFVPFPKIARLSREIIVTEKIDGTNALICILESGEMLVGSRTRWITTQDDNYGFAKWAEANKTELMKLGVGHHFGEWWGQGIQRNYSQQRKIFSLFNTTRWSDDEQRPACCSVVPVLYSGAMEDYGVMKGVKHAISTLQRNGSFAAPGFMKPEGIVIFHPQGNILFKKTLEKDDEPKSKAKAA
jgi:hypothetical protein